MTNLDDAARRAPMQAGRRRPELGQFFGLAFAVAVLAYLVEATGLNRLASRVRNDGARPAPGRGHLLGGLLAYRHDAQWD